MDVHNLKYDLSLLTEAIKARQFAQGGADVVSQCVHQQAVCQHVAGCSAQQRTL
jgi:hypothetical protein